MGKFVDMAGWNMWEHGVPDSKLTVLKRVDDHITTGGKALVQWMCRCKCGNIVIATANSIKKGNIKSCGCIQHEDLTGKIFHRLTVIKKNGIDNNGSFLWECECSCGNQYHPLISTTALKYGRTKSCGCLKKELTSQRSRKYNTYNISGEFGIGWTTNTNTQFYFDLEDYDLIKNYCWLENDQGYIVTRTTEGKFNLRLHRLVLHLNTEDPIVDHKNRQKYDNRKQNLRLSDKQTNNINRGANKNNKLGIKGVVQLTNGRYRAKIERNGQIYSKTSANLNEVVVWRQQKEKELYGDFAYNYIEENNNELQQSS